MRKANDGISEPRARTRRPALIPPSADETLGGRAGTPPQKDRRRGM